MSKKAKARLKAQKEQERLKRAFEKDLRMKNPGGGSPYAAKGRRIAKGDQPRFADNPDVIIDEPDVSNDVFDISELFSDASDEPLAIDTSIHHRPYNTREGDVKIIVSEGYRGAGAVPFYFLGEYIYPPENAENLRDKPCFLVAEKNDDTWKISRYVGISSGDYGNPSFVGTIDVIFDNGYYGIDQEYVVEAFKKWSESQPVGYISNVENNLFGHAPKVGSDTQCYESFSFERTGALPSEDIRFRNTSGQGYTRRDHRL